MRGLDYYTRTAFEFYREGAEGQQSALAGGGRYDGLVELLGGKPTPGIGFAIGLDRVVLALSEAGVAASAPDHPTVVVCGADPADTVTRLRIATDLRAAGLSARADLNVRKLGRQLENAAREAPISPSSWATSWRRAMSSSGTCPPPRRRSSTSTTWRAS